MECIILTLLSVIVNLIRGSPKFPSIVNMSLCSWTSWMILAAFVVICLARNYYNVVQIMKE